MLLRKIEGGPTGRLCDTLMIAESANFKKHPLLSPTPIESTPKEKSYPSLWPQLLCGKLRNEFHLKWVPWPFVGFHLDSPHFITYQITLTSHTLLSLLFSSVFFVFFVWQFLSHFTTNLKRYANLSKKGAMLSFAEVGETFVDSVVLRQCIFLIDIYIPHLCVQCIALRTTLW